MAQRHTTRRREGGETKNLVHSTESWKRDGRTQHKEDRETYLHLLEGRIKVLGRRLGSVFLPGRMAVARNREGSRGSSALLRGAREHISSAHHVLLEVKLGRSEQISLCGTEERRKRRGGSRKRRIVGKGVGDVRTSILTPFDGGEIKVNKVLSSTTTTVSLPMSTLFVLISRSAEVL